MYNSSPHITGCSGARPKLSAHHSSCSQKKLQVKNAPSQAQSFSLYEHLPENAAILGHVLQSSQSLLALMRHMGGCTVRIPRLWPPYGQKAEEAQHPLREILSIAQMQAVVQHFGGTDVYIPKGARYLAQARNASIIQGFTKATRAGASSSQVVRNLAKEYGLSDRRVWGILKTTPHASEKSLLVAE